MWKNLLSPGIITSFIIINTLFSSVSAQAQYRGMTIEEYRQFKKDVENGLLEEPSYSGSADATRQGGDTPETALVINSLPYIVQGTTTGYSNHINSASCGQLTGPDVFYAFRPWLPIQVSLTTCSSYWGFDTKLAVFEQIDNELFCIAYNDDQLDCPYFPFLSTLTADLCPGRWYYFVVDGFVGDSGPYELTVTKLGPSDRECPDLPVGFIPVSNWAVGLGIFLILGFSIIAYRRFS